YHDTVRSLSCHSHDYCFCFFFFNDPATTEIYTLSLHDALPISSNTPATLATVMPPMATTGMVTEAAISPRRSSPSGSPASGLERDRKSTRLNSSHVAISYAVFCLKKKKNQAK